MSRLRALLGDYPQTRAIRQGTLRAPTVELEFAEEAVPNKAFKRVVRDMSFDVAELALMTFLMARALGRPLVLLPVVVFSRNPLQYLVCNAAKRRVTPADMAGCRIGVRSYTTTTAVWVRGLLQQEFGVDPSSLDWITLEESHVAEFADPPNVRRGSPDAKLGEMLMSWEIDAAIVDPVPADARVVPVVPDHEQILQTWQSRHHAQTINHMVVVHEQLARDHPGVVREVLELFRAAGLVRDREWLRPSLEIAAAYAHRQGLIARPLSVEEMFDASL